MDYWPHLMELGFQPSGGPDGPDAVAKLEALIGVPLPADYRAFLLSVGGGDLDAYAPCSVPNPFGGLFSVTCLHGVAEVINLLDSTVAPRNMVCIGYGHSTSTTCLSVAGLDHGQVFALDGRRRYFWGHELANMPSLAPSIREFFRLRDAHQLPGRPWGYENCYHLADSFPEFARSLQS